MRHLLCALALLTTTFLFAAPPANGQAVYAVFELKKKASPAEEARLAQRVKAFAQQSQSGKKRGRTVALTDGKKTRRYLTVRKFRTEAEALAYLDQFKAALPKAERRLLKRGFALNKRQYRKGKKVKSLRKGIKLD